jgi:hypothetical protein
VSKKKKSLKSYSSLTAHKREKSKLIAPLHRIQQLEVLDWERDILPEHLWIESLSSTYLEDVWQKIYEKFLDALDEYCPEGIDIYGFISDFVLIPADKREEFVNKNEHLIYEAFYKPFGRIIAFYPESPCYWLLQKKYLDIERPLDSAVELRKLSAMILRLMPGKDLYAGHIRTLPLSRALKHGHVYFKRGMEIAELLPKYPKNCNEDEKYRVQQFARMMINMEFQRLKHYKAREWPRYFWRLNLDLVPCVPRSIEFKKNLLLNDSDINMLRKCLEKNSNTAIDYLEEISLKHRYDLYETEKDEILLGLFSRLTRLYVLISLDSNFWARDIAGIMLRCLTDTAISFGYLAKAGTEKEFKEFKCYGEGKEKLLMLHLQDTYSEKKSLEGRSCEEIAEEMGWSFMPELIDIELGNWTKKSARELAIEAELEELYRIIYDPTSSDLHGTWMSIKKSNLVRCIQPLHRFHRMPLFNEPPLFVHTIKAVQDIYLRCVKIGMEVLEFPEMRAQFGEIKTPS